MQPIYQQLILEGIKDLPPEVLVEIVDFIYLRGVHNSLGKGRGHG